MPLPEACNHQAEHLGNVCFYSTCKGRRSDEAAAMTKKSFKRHSHESSPQPRCFCWLQRRNAHVQCSMQVSAGSVLTKAHGFRAEIILLFRTLRVNSLLDFKLQRQCGNASESIKLNDAWIRTYSSSHCPSKTKMPEMTVTNQTAWFMYCVWSLFSKWEFGLCLGPVTTNWNATQDMWIRLGEPVYEETNTASHRHW